MHVVLNFEYASLPLAQDETTAFYQRQVWASDLQSNMRGQYALGITKTPGLTREVSEDQRVGE